MSDGVLLNWFKAVNCFEIATRGTVFTGPAPFNYREEGKIVNRRKWFDVPWVISHEEARKDCLYKVIGVEAYATMRITKGTPVGLLVKEIL